MTRVNVFIAYFLPGTRAGGPIRSVANLVHAVGTSFDFSVLTLNHDFGDPTPYEGIAPFRWREHGPCRVQYLAPGWRTLRTIVASALDDEVDVLYINSVFERRFSMLPLWSRVMTRRSLARVVLAPRGELAEAALRSKPRRKAAYLNLLRLARVPEKVTWMASSVYEERDIRRTFGDQVRVRLAPPLPAAPSAAPVADDVSLKKPGNLRVLFVGRLVSHKGLHVALEHISKLEGNVRLEIAGPIEDESYWRECRELMEALPPNIDVNYLGVLGSDDLQEALRRADLFMLPTRSENFGHAIAEALAAGLPVLISDGTPWRGLEEAGVGWDLPLTDAGGFVRALETMLGMDGAALRALKARATAYADEHARDPARVEANTAIFREAARQRP